MAYLALVRHGISEWNKKGLWTGWTDVSLAPEGFEEAKRTGVALRDIPFDNAFTSDLLRAQQTLKVMEDVFGYKMPTLVVPELKERNYGDLTGKNKWEIREKYGDDQFLKWRRGWDDEIPGGETLKQVYQRVVPYFESKILPFLKAGKNVLISAHGNSLRALVKFLENISDEKIAEVEINTGEAFVYSIGSNGEIESKEVRATNQNPKG